ncbi:MAG: nicotinate-nucleotide--dimethylbenzimidazole phosphoribosyltransferase [Actinomycetia bacterium]|nr:nicotinate-nucleotide--dimethylbenzimidazole phosphoribosyltransferase [Actinomycetes bacterium]
MNETLIRPGEPAPSPTLHARRTAEERLAGLAIPRGALGRLGDLSTWLSGVQGTAPPRPLHNVRAVVFAGDHGVAEHGVSAYPREVTPAMVRAFLRGDAGVAVLARQHGVHLRALDIAVDDELDDVPAAVRKHKIRRGSGAIGIEDALTRTECLDALRAGATVAAEEIDAGADLLIGGDMGIGNTTPAAAIVAATLGLPAAHVVGRGTGVDDTVLAHKEAVIDAAVARARTAHESAGSDSAGDAITTLVTVGSADIAAGVGYLVGAARGRTPVLLVGLISVAEALVAEDLCPGALQWFHAGHRST